MIYGGIQIFENLGGFGKKFIQFREKRIRVLDK